MLWIIILAIFLIVRVQSECPMRPSPSQTVARRTPGDGEYQIMISGSSNKYIPEINYMISLRGSEDSRQFTRFILSIDSFNNSLTRTGYFQLFPDTLTQFHEECINTISEANDKLKSEVDVIWRAPSPGSGCVKLRAMVLEDSSHWYATDGALSRTICEMTLREIAEMSEDSCCACEEAKYSMTFEGIWSNRTHPKDFPFSVWLTHFSDVVGASHASDFSFWGEGHIATDGFRQLAEWGSASGLESELKNQARYLRTFIKAAGLWYPNVNANTTAKFRVDRIHPLLSVASMFGPSPDWVVGVSKLNLCRKDCSWIENMTIELYPWDAGTDNGITYMSPNSETSPRQRMKPITTSYPEDPRSPFYNPSGESMLPLAKLHLNREGLIHKDCDDHDIRKEISEFEVTENTGDTERPECLTTEYSPWSVCSVSCGKGIRMRTRDYRMPEKAAMMGCNVQLVSKEMCLSTQGDCQDDEETILSFAESECRTTEWSGWSECSSSCGPGVMTRTRKLLNRDNRKKCNHVSIIEKKKCLETSCSPGTEELLDPKCPVSDWSIWSPCTASCGEGVKARARLFIGDPSNQEYCSSRVELQQEMSCTINADCHIDEEVAKVICMEKIDVGPCRGYFQRWAYDHHKRLCVPFIFGGCRGNRNNFVDFAKCNETCNSIEDSPDGLSVTRNQSKNEIQPELSEITSRTGSYSPINCAVSAWYPWSSCSVSCGQGIMTSYRVIKRQPENGGSPCPKKLHRRAHCNLAPCSE